jgi:hypothetical protein
MFFTGILTASLVKKLTKRNIDEGERDNNFGKPNVSLAIDFLETARLVSSVTTSSARFDPRKVNSPGQFRST